MAAWRASAYAGIVVKSRKVNEGAQAFLTAAKTASKCESAYDSSIPNVRYYGANATGGRE